MVTKYKIAADCVNAATRAVLEKCVAGAKIVDACAAGDASIERETGKYYNKKDKDGNKVEKGVAFPTCVSVNNCVCHNSPGAGDEKTFQDGDAVKIDLGGARRWVRGDVRADDRHRWTKGDGRAGGRHESGGIGV